MRNCNTDLCSICQTELGKFQCAEADPCQHIFHLRCIQAQWGFTVNSTCPNCREVLSGNFRYCRANVYGSLVPQGPNFGFPVPRYIHEVAMRRNDLRSVVLFQDGYMLYDRVFKNGRWQYQPELYGYDALEDDSEGEYPAEPNLSTFRNLSVTSGQSGRCLKIFVILAAGIVIGIFVASVAYAQL